MAQHDPLELTTAGTAAYAAWAGLWLAAEALSHAAGGPAPEGPPQPPLAAQLGGLLAERRTAALLLYAGLGPGALSTYLQALGQRVTSPAKAQALYGSTPLWSALIAGALLGGADTALGGPLAWAGAAVLLGASALAALWDALGSRAGGGGGALAGVAARKEAREL